MILIAHRGNVDGPEPALENSPDYIDRAISKGYDVEIDLRMVDWDLYLGHDSAQYAINKDWLEKRQSNLWIHCKDWQSLFWIRENLPNAFYFTHEQDSYNLVNGGFIWCHDLTPVMNKRCIIPLLDDPSLLKKEPSLQDCYAVCSDYVKHLKS